VSTFDFGAGLLVLAAVVGVVNDRTLRLPRPLALLTGMLLAIRRGLIEETDAASTDELVLIDMAVVAYANAMRLQSMIGNTALIIESGMFGHRHCAQSARANSADDQRTSRARGRGARGTSPRPTASTGGTSSPHSTGKHRSHQADEAGAGDAGRASRGGSYRIGGASTIGAVRDSAAQHNAFGPIMFMIGSHMPRTHRIRDSYSWTDCFSGKQAVGSACMGTPQHIRIPALATHQAT
jgi:hypothetical protein